MYGLLIESICEYLRERFGDEKWMIICERASIQNLTFSTHQIYSEKHIPRIASAASEVTCVHKQDLMNSFGIEFVGFVGKYGYDQILRVLGRHMRDFLNGLDNLHEYLRFSYPKIRPPSFFASEETRHGLTLHYRSKRKGFLHYSIGQLKQVGRSFYNLDVQVEVVSEDFKSDNTYCAVFRLYFDNKEFRGDLGSTLRIRETWHIKSDEFFEFFPFCIVFDTDLIIRHLGPQISTVLPDLVGVKITDVFSINRPIIGFTWDELIVHTNNIFEIASIDRVNADTVFARRTSAPNHKKTTTPPTGLLAVNSTNRRASKSISSKHAKPNYDVTSELRAFEQCTGENNEVQKGIIESESEDENSLRPRRLYLKGQMKYMAQWNCMIYLCSPLMPNLDAMFRTGLYINDLSLHDSSRDLVLAGTQQSVELKLALDQEQRKSAKLAESMKKLDIEMKRTDSLLYQMIPRQVAERLRRGEPALSTCEVFKDVTILFSDVVGFTQICSMITPMAVVSMLNAMYSKFDKLTEQHKVYKVETIGDAYMVVSGAPTKTKYHAEHIADMALDMVTGMRGLKDPASGDFMKIRIGIHSGMVVAGVVGLKMPRYCLFGDTVNTASRMETSGDTMKIHMSHTTKLYLEHAPYILIERGTLDVKGKGEMKTYFLEGKRVSVTQPNEKTVHIVSVVAVAEIPRSSVESKVGVTFTQGTEMPTDSSSKEDEEYEEYKTDFPMTAVQRRSDIDLSQVSEFSVPMSPRSVKSTLTVSPEKEPAFRQRSSSANSQMLPSRLDSTLETGPSQQRRNSLVSFLSADYTPVSFSDVDSITEQGPTMQELEQMVHNERERKLEKARRRAKSKSSMDESRQMGKGTSGQNNVEKGDQLDDSYEQLSTRQNGDGDESVPGTSGNIDNGVEGLTSQNERQGTYRQGSSPASAQNKHGLSLEQSGPQNKNVARTPLNPQLDNYQKTDNLNHNIYPNNNSENNIITEPRSDTKKTATKSTTCLLL